MVSHKDYHLNVNKDFFISIASKSIVYFIDSFTLGTKSQPNAYLLIGREHIYWIWALKFRCTQYGFRGLDNLQDCKDNFFFVVRQDKQHFSTKFRKVFVGLPKGYVSQALALILLGDPFLKKLITLTSGQHYQS